MASDVFPFPAAVDVNVQEGTVALVKRFSAVKLAVPITSSVRMGYMDFRN
jgi:hypothetical protein